MAKEVNGTEVKTMTHTAKNVSNTASTVLAANEDRNYCTFINDSDTVIYLNLGATAVANTGIRLTAAGGSYKLSAADNIWQGAVSAIHGGGAVNKVLLVTEGTVD